MAQPGRLSAARNPPKPRHRFSGSVVFLRFLITKHKTLEFTRIRKIKDTPRAGGVSVRTAPDAARDPRTGTGIGKGEQ